MSEEAQLQQAAVETTPEQAAQQPVAAPEQQQQTDADTAAQAKQGDDEEHRVPKGVQKRIDRLTREKYQLQARLEMLERVQQAPQQQSRQVEQAAQQSTAPKLEQYQSIEEYLDALADFKAAQKADKVFKEREASERMTQQQREQAKLHDGYAKQTEQARQSYEDFDDVVENPDLPITQAMAEAIMRSQNGADVAYYLGKNPTEAARLANLDPFSAAVEIGRIAATVVRPQPRKATSAPPPIQPVGTRATPVSDPEKMSTEEWLKWRQGQLKNR